MATPKLATLTGIDVVVRNMDLFSKRQAMRASRALKLGAVHVERKSLEIVPVDTGNLKGSWRITNVGGTGFKTVLRIGYIGVEYSIYVHEDMDKKHGKEYNIKYAKEIAAGLTHSRGEKQQAKFLEVPLRNERRAFLKLVYRELKI